jgi:cyanophycinase
VPGSIALLGSGEYLNVMNATDAYLLQTVGGADQARVVLMPTASGLEANGPTYWNNLGLHHFKALGVKDIRASLIIDRASAADEKQLRLLNEADIYYFSGGNPQHCIEMLRDTPAWEMITAAYDRGAILAGCSAGAMMLSGHTIALRQMMEGGKPGLTKALGVVPRFVVFPHFDRMANFMNQHIFEDLLATLPEGHIALGIDEDTALVRVTTPNSNDAFATARWRVMGQQTVKIFERGEVTSILRIGEEATL